MTPEDLEYQAGTDQYVLAISPYRFWTCLQSASPVCPRSLVHGVSLGPPSTTSNAANTPVHFLCLFRD